MMLFRSVATFSSVWKKGGGEVAAEYRKNTRKTALSLIAGGKLLRKYANIASINEI